MDTTVIEVVLFKAKAELAHTTRSCAQALAPVAQCVHMETTSDIHAEF